MPTEIVETLPVFDTLALTAVRQDPKDLRWHPTPLLVSLRQNKSLFRGQDGKPWEKELASFRKSATTMEYINKCKAEGKPYSRVKANLIVALGRRIGRQLSTVEVGKLDKVTLAIEDLARRTRLSPHDTTRKDHAPWADKDVDLNLFTEVCLSQMKIPDKNPDPGITEAASKIIAGEPNTQDRPPPPPPPAQRPPVEIPLPTFMTNELPVVGRKDGKPLGALRHGEKTIVPLTEEGIRFTLPLYPDAVLIGREGKQPPNEDFKLLVLAGAGDEMSREHVAIAWTNEYARNPPFLTFAMKNGEYAPVVIVEKVGDEHHMKLLYPHRDYFYAYDVCPASGDLNNIFLILPDQVYHGTPTRAVMVNFQRKPYTDVLGVEVKADSQIAPGLYKKAYIEGKKAIPKRTMLIRE